MRSWITRYHLLARLGRWRLFWTGSWIWFPTCGGARVYATRFYQELYGERWWRLWMALRLGPFELVRWYDGLERSEAACTAAARRWEKSLEDLRAGRLHDQEDVFAGTDEEDYSQT